LWVSSIANAAIEPVMHQTAASAHTELVAAKGKVSRIAFFLEIKTVRAGTGRMDG